MQYVHLFFVRRSWRSSNILLLKYSGVQCAHRLLGTCLNSSCARLYQSSNAMLQRLLEFLQNIRLVTWSISLEFPLWICVCHGLITELNSESSFELINRDLCPIHVVTFTLISNLATDYIQKRRGEPGLFSFEYNMSPKLISK